MCKISLIQFKVNIDKDKNIKNAEKLIEKAYTDNQSDLIVLPEMFTTPYEIKYFKDYADNIPNSKTCSMLSEISKKHEITIVGGSIPEYNEKLNQYYNSSCIYKNGELIHIQRKIHLFDVDLPTVKIKESDTFSRGNQIKIIETKNIKFAVVICFDIRFPSMLKSIRDKGADLIIIPAAFSDTTGNAHWHTLAKARAIDNQLYIALCSPSKNHEIDYPYFGHSLITNPWGEIISEAKTEEKIISAKIDKNFIKQTKANMPLKDIDFTII